MSERFQLFRLPCFARQQMDAFEVSDASRADFLRRVFGSQWEFGHYGNRFYYEPDLAHSTDRLLVGRLGRRVVAQENLPPDQHLEETVRESWKACLLLVDPTDHEDGQKAAIEIDKTIGGAPALMSAFTRAVNQQGPLAAFVLEAQPIFDASSFWHFAEENRGRVISLTFDLVTPNGLWNASTSIKEELAEFRRALRTQQVSTTFKSQEGLDTDSPRIREAVEYAETGSGKIRAAAKGKKYFNSAEKPKIVALEGELHDKHTLLERALRRIKAVLGRE